MEKSPPLKTYHFFKGRVALHATLKAMGIGPGDQVLLPGYTCVVVPNAILYLGAEPVFLDIDPVTYNLDPPAVRAWLESSANRRARVLIVQHTYGIPCDMDALLPLAQKHRLMVVEDSCHALGSTYQGRPVGTLGDAAFFSSQWSKPCTTGLGGWATTRDPALSEAMDNILAAYARPGWGESLVLNFQYLVFALAYRPRWFWLIQSLYRKMGQMGLAIGSSTAAELACEEPNQYMKSMGGIQERQLGKKLAQVDRMVAQRKRDTGLVEEMLLAAGLRPLELPPALDPAILRYPVRIGNKENVLAEAQRHKVHLGDWFVSPVHPNLDHWEAAGYKKGSCPVGEMACNTTINIPLGPRISKQELERTVRFLGRFAHPA